ncbi:MAG TPA: DUF3426 domain-containing protein [Rhizomicrobium sp.]|nr:DUF3426 domain-containing protein [Rhizomicrobium sp.]
MILICPQCATRYEADGANFLPAGRKVRCAKCSHVWHQDPPPEAVAALAPPLEPEPRAAAFVAPPVAAPAPVAIAAAMPGRVQAAAPSRGMARLGLGLGWVALVAVILVIGWSALTWREQVATAWPRTASFYASLGLSVNPVGIGFADVSHAEQTEDGQPVLAIRGKLVNLSSRAMAVPQIEVTLTDAAKRPVLSRSFAPAIATLQPGQITTFLARLSSPPSDARHLELRFAGR